MTKITTFLWFDHNAKEAVEYYQGVFPDSKIRQESGAAAPRGS